MGIVLTLGFIGTIMGVGGFSYAVYEGIIPIKRVQKAVWEITMVVISIFVVYFIFYIATHLPNLLDFFSSRLNDLYQSVSNS